MVDRGTMERERTPRDAQAVSQRLVAALGFSLLTRFFTAVLPTPKEGIV